MTKEELRDAIAERQYRVRIMPGRVICADCLGGNVGADIPTFLAQTIRSAACWHLENDRPPRPFVSKVSLLV